MELTIARLADTRQAFDGVAREYGRTNLENPILCGMRQRVMSLLTARVPAGASLLDLGCGPGLDAEWLALRGYRVTAIDASPKMVDAARARMARAGRSAVVNVERIGIQQLDALGDARFDAVYSNFGPLNCVPDLDRVAANVARVLRPHGVFVASVMGRICPWEVARYGSTGQWDRVRIRFAPGFVAVPLDGRTVWTRYYTPREFAAPFVANGFAVSSINALGLLLPPPYLQGFHRRHPRLMRWLDRAERRVSHWPCARGMGDHFAMAMRRAPAVGEER